MSKRSSLSHRRLFILFFLINLFSYSFPLLARTVVISDIDDTIKKSNSVGKPLEQAYHFLRKVPYLEMRDLYNEIKSHEEARGETIKFLYVSAANEKIFRARPWITKHNFPAGESYLKTKETKAPTYEFKHETIKKLLSAESKTLKAGEPLHVLMFGDNAQVDQIVYSDLTREMNLDSEIFIRDVRGEATFFDSTLPIKKLPGVNYYFSEMELFALPTFDYLSNDLRVRTLDAYLLRKLIPAYTLKALERRLEDVYGDKNRAKDEAKKFWNDYHHRF